MDTELRAEIVMPTRADKTRVIAVAVGCTLLGAGIAMLAFDPTDPTSRVEPAPVVAPPRPVDVAPAPPASAPPAPPAAPGPRASELGFVLQAGGASYLKLADLDAAAALPRHGSVQLFEQDGKQAAVAAVALADVPAAHRVWQSRSVVVDGACRAKLTGFAIVSRVTGDPAYAGLTAETWTAATVLAHGTRVLAARLDGCTEGTFARDAALPPIVIPEEIQDDELASAARRLLLASPAAKDTQTDWTEHGGEGLWHMQSAITATVLRHPRTGATWVSVHAHADHECGGPTVNVWGLFRAEPSGKLTPLQLRQLGDLESIDKLVDLEDDGQLELIGRPWLGLDVLATRGDGTELARLGLQFYGCPC